MVTVRLFGLLRLDTRRSTLSVAAATVGEMLVCVADELAVPAALLRQVVVFVNGAPAGARVALKDGDEVYLLSPVAGG